jgi:hypothetical protein
MRRNTIAPLSKAPIMLSLSVGAVDWEKETR